ncbi:MAG TPA: hypothetical protein VH301_15655 [Usitatibacter sp.]|nr:hypothetical protein [Usitatibacter sp.]
MEKLLAAAAKTRPADPRSREAARVRDRYIAVRFEGIARSSADLSDPERVIKAARLQFEEGHPEAALELIELAVEQDRSEPSLWLAELELAFLLRMRRHFIETARAFREAHPGTDAWTEIDRLGRALAPDEPTFRERGKRAHDHYGPWPHLPNWIGAPWDLTSEVLGADFHAAMTQGAPQR